MNLRIAAAIFSLALVSYLPEAVLAASAVAFDKAADKLGYCHSRQTVDEAKQCAISACGKAGGRDCRLVGAGTKGGYSAVARTRGTVGTFLSSYEDETMVSVRAVNDCAEKAARCDAGDWGSPEFNQCVARSGCKVVATWHEPEVTSPAAKAGPREQQQPMANGAASPEERNARAKMLIEQAHELFQAKRYADAARAYSQAIDADPANPAAWNGRGASNAAGGALDAARQDLDRAIALNPRYSQAYFNRAIVNRQTGQQQGYLEDMNRAAQLGNDRAKSLLANAQNYPMPSPAQNYPMPAPVQNHPIPSPAQNYPAPSAAPAQRIDTSGGYQTCSVQANAIANRGGTERPMNPVYDNVCLAILPPTCRDWTVNHKPCAARACVVNPELNRCPNGEPPAYVAKNVLPVTPEELALMNAQINAEASRRANVIDPGHRGLNPAQVGAMEDQRKGMWNSTGPGMVYQK